MRGGGEEEERRCGDTGLTIYTDCVSHTRERDGGRKENLVERKTPYFSQWQGPDSIPICPNIQY